jgi:hypothetical protein
MSTVNELHNQAMDIAEDAFMRQRNGDNQAALLLFRHALILEQQAAFMLELLPENEPSRSILFRSASSLAYNAADYETAEKLAAQGLAGYPPPEIAEELRDLFDEINFGRHLSTKGMELSASEWKMTLLGSSITKGITPANHLLTRVDKVSTLVRRTVERKLHLPFQVNQASPDERRDRFGLFVKAMVPSSFAVIFQLGKPIQQLPLLANELEPQEVVDEVLLCLEYIQYDEVDELKKRIDNQEYYDNFVGLAKQIAPDGKEIKNVGFTVIRGGEDKPIQFKKNKREINSRFSRTPTEDSDDELETINLEGILTFANTPATKKFGTVRIRQQGVKKEIPILVPLGLMKDVVQPYYDENVIIAATIKNGKYFYNDMDKKS